MFRLIFGMPVMVMACIFSAYAQQETMYPVNLNTWIPDGNYTNGTRAYNASGTVYFGGTHPVNQFSSTQQAVTTVESGKTVIRRSHLGGSGGGKFHATSGTGARIGSNYDFNAANGNVEVPIYEKIEFGIDLPAELDARIALFLNTNQSAADPNHVGLNPYDPQDISIEATINGFKKVYSPDPNSNLPGVPVACTMLVYGFYYQDVSIDQQSDDWIVSNSRYPFRIRFAPQEIGAHAISFTIKYKNLAGVTVTEPINGLVFDQNGVPTASTVGLVFNAVANTSGKAKAKGYLEVGKDKRHFRHAYTRESFFGIGMNLPEIQQTNWAYKHAGYKSRRDDIFTSFHNNGGNLVRILAFDDLNGVDNLTVKKIGYVNNPCYWPDGTPYNNVWVAGDANQYQLGNYQMNQMHMWETDRDINKCEELDIFLIYCIQIHYPFSIMPTRAYYEGWATNAYKRELNLSDNVIDFFENEEARRFFRNKLRYMQARWGYSTAIGAWQLASEINQFGQKGDKDDHDTDCPADDEFTNVQSPWNPKYFDEAGEEKPNEDYDYLFASEMYDWHCDMSEYIKMIHPGHLITTGYAVNVFNSPLAPCDDQSFRCDNIDFITMNLYNFDNSWESSRDFGVDAFFHTAELSVYTDPSNNICGTDEPGYFIDKPIVIFETGAMNSCTDLDFHNNLWQGLCSGHAATPLAWTGAGTVSDFEPFFRNFNGIRQFTDGIDFESNKYTPAFTKKCQLVDRDGVFSGCNGNQEMANLEIFVMREVDNGNSKRGFGWVRDRKAHNKTVNNGFDPANNTCLSFQNPFYNYSEGVPNRLETVKLKDFEAGDYNTYLFDTRSGNSMGSLGPGTHLYASTLQRLHLQIPLTDFEPFNGSATAWNMSTPVRSDYSFKFNHTSLPALRESNNENTAINNDEPIAIESSDKSSTQGIDHLGCKQLNELSTIEFHQRIIAQEIKIVSITDFTGRKVTENLKTDLTEHSLAPGAYIYTVQISSGFYCNIKLIKS